MTYNFTTSLVGILIAGGILYLVRRDHLHARRALFWLAVAGGALLFGIFPQASDWLAHQLGVKYPPILILLGAQAILTIKLLLVDMNNTQIEHDLRRLNQRLALHELELSQQLNEKLPEANTMSTPCRDI